MMQLIASPKEVAMTVEEFLRDAHVQAAKLFPEASFAFVAIETTEDGEACDLTLMTNLDDEGVAELSAQLTDTNLQPDEAGAEAGRPGKWVM
jgi:hypothetical protein